MNKEITLNIDPKGASDKATILRKARESKEAAGMDVKSFRIVRRSIDARKKPVRINLSLLISDSDEIEIEKREHEYKPVGEDASQVVIVGAGPAGLFAALKAIELGLRPVVVERGKDVDSRRVDIARISREGKVMPDSNYCFGEGGAGAFSDGKLFTRSKKRGSIREVLEILHQFGASEDILINSHPHIGSDKLPGIIKKIREKIRECGGEVRFNCKMEDLIIENGKVKGIITSEGGEIYGPVFLATGHSAREIYDLLHSRGVKIEPKGIAMGVRLEHPQELIDRLQYHSEDGRGKWLPAAEYSFVSQEDGRGVYSFCMCPGGVIVPAVSGEGQLVVNGMSASARSGKWANSGIVVEIRPEDIEEEENSQHPLEMLRFQEKIEKKFSEESGGKLNAPAQRMTDFIEGRETKELPATSYAPGIHPARLDRLFPKEISKRLRSGLISFGKKCRGFVTDDGIMIGLESRTSSPVRIPRDESTMRHPDLEDLYPVGEGAGYAGGIVSSAIDGMNSISAYYNKSKSSQSY